MRRDGRRRADHRRAVDAERRERRSCPEHVRDGATAEQRRAVDDPCVAAELVGGVDLPRPDLAVVESGDRRVALGVAQRRQHRDERGQGIRSRAAEHSRVDLRRQGIDADDDVDHAAQAHRGRRVPDGGVARVAHEDGVGSQQVGVLRHEVLQPAGALLLRALDDELEVDRHLVPERAQCRQVHDDVALAVSRSSAEPSIAHLGELERRCAPSLVVQWRLDVVVGVEQHRRGVGVGSRP